MNIFTCAKKFSSTLVWRNERGLHDTSTPKPDHLRNSFLPVGLDRRKYVVIYSNHARAEYPTNQNAEIQFDHAFRVIETACDDTIGIARTLWVIDFNQFGFKHINKRHIVLGCSWFGTHNPERLGDLVLLNPPKIFMALWRFIHIFLDPDSAKRIIVCKSEAEAASYLNTYCSADTVDWLIAASRMRPSIGGGYPPGTDFSLIEQTKWKGPPMASTLSNLRDHEWSSARSPNAESTVVKETDNNEASFDPLPPLRTDMNKNKNKNRSGGGGGLQSQSQLGYLVFYAFIVFVFLAHTGQLLLAAFVNGILITLFCQLFRSLNIPILYFKTSKVQVMKERVKRKSHNIKSLFPPVSPK
eukprot:CAMPEP_0114357116 /NCGR_PEP_ID=MMETSP0101-20121206/21407_1 /TAXON_ID=38822 ORGANISM="Pteridomonas danica, Strain PT" /NCGR_SAMPLE_ID=MMETSP0101 /ASSEMBLY_ACC=CAM_ASM_000211 /LENGTH=355 /DNA_ID=CAMNT_0001499761 /DNA_START=229 /DNA_END=1296 /DNA_ORIENTATION=+